MMIWHYFWEETMQTVGSWLTIGRPKLTHLRQHSWQKIVSSAHVQFTKANIKNIIYSGGLLNVIMKNVLSLIILSLKGNSKQPDQTVDFM
jgi:hypothetical protein